MKLSKAKHLRGMVEKAADRGLEDAEALVAAELFPRWSGEAVYEKDQRVCYEGVLYRCLQGHTAQPGWDPVSAPSLWAKVLIPDENVIPAWEQPDSQNAYSIGDRVLHQGSIWISIVEQNVWEPGVYGWEVMV